MINEIPVFYACDDNFAKYTAVSVKSLIENADSRRNYHIHILNTSISEENRDILLSMQTDRFKISFDDVTSYSSSLHDKLPMRDYYTRTTYFRLFIADMFPEYSKAIYIDSDTVVLGNIAELYDIDISDSYVAAAHEQAMVQTDVYGKYVEQVVGIDRNAFFNAGVLLINCELFRNKNLLGRFVNLLHEYNFVVTQDEDYLNIICKDRVHWLGQEWNCEVYGEILCKPEDIKILHYIMVSKPWHYEDARFKEYFWKYANMTPCVDAIKKVLADYTDEQRNDDEASCDRLAKTALNEINREDNYLRNLRKKQAKDRVEVLERIEKLENDGKFDIDVEDDPPSRELKADEIDYLHKGAVNRIKTAAAFAAARAFVYRLIRNNQLIVKDIIGIENFRDLNSGAVITCNHFNAFDSFAIHMAYYASGHKDRKFYRVIREGNYTNFPGFYGFLMRNCNTLPLSSNVKTMGMFIRGVNQLLLEGNFVLFYPEQSMWWNYRKPKPLKDGAYQFAAKNNVPILPCFITMKDSDIMGEDGFYVQEYTIHIGEPIYPDTSKKVRENVAMLKEANSLEWKKVYEEEYGIPLQYSPHTSFDGEQPLDECANAAKV